MKPLTITLALAVATASATDLFIPLYQYPLPGAWTPINQTLTDNPTLTTKIVINPSNGPDGLPNSDYAPNTQMLGAHPNAQLLGYIHTAPTPTSPRCTRPYADLVADIRTWSQWVSDFQIPIRGIFIDEAPTNTANDCVAYMQNLTNFIRDDASLAFPSPRLVVFNPGGIGNPSLQPYYDMNPDLIVALETCFTDYQFSRGDTPNTGDQCDPTDRTRERYDHEGYGSSLDRIVFPNIGRQNAARTAILVHGVHDNNGPSANFQASEDVLRNMIQAVVRAGIGATFFNTLGYHNFDEAPGTIQVVARLLREANETPA
ncbi:Spherulation-specific family 4-domain-containing protein [Apodospora peruviana]|uniref:Spherulation-specific family 4-domain-containing protein n=1 Tax=Apodospora peruviana TaxID=516989 RepID=A0AAE0M1A0_9PEZI|nr:Spherulation-specific family 4-domain-containing protein [Apodospora peruviana]